MCKRCGNCGWWDNCICDKYGVHVYEDDVCESWKDDVSGR